MEFSKQTVTLSILETSDVHGHILPIHYADNRPYQVGLAKISTLIQRERKSTPYTLLIDNGDLIQGTPLTYYHARIDNQPENPVVKVLNYLQYDAAVVGNHELNYGQAVLQKAMHESNFPWLSANIVKRGTDEPYYGKPYFVKQFPNGPKVGVLGLTTQYIPNWENPRHIEELEFLDVVAAAKKWVPILRDQEQVDVLVISYHGGFERDLDSGEPTEQLTKENQGYQLCIEVPRFDVLLTGHQHRTIAGTTVNGVAVIQPGQQGRMLGKVTVTCTKQENRWVVESKQTELLPIDHVEADPTVIDLVSDYEFKTQTWLDQPMGRINGNMRVTDPMTIRTKDNPLIEFINKVQMEYGHAGISNTALFDNESPGFPSDVTMRDVVANYIYPNTLRVLRVTGQDIKDALEQSAAYFAEYTGRPIEVNPQFSTPKPQHYNYDMWEGIEYKINISRPVGQRVVTLTYKGQPLDLKREYEVVMNNYRAGGGGNYFMFQGKEVVRDIPTDVSELIANFILERKIIEATCDHNWEVIHD